VTSNTSSTRQSLVWTLRIAALAIVSFGVSGTLRHAFAQLAEHEWTVRPGWLLLSGVVYAIGLMPMGLFWHRTLTALGCPTPLVATMRAYLLGHLGKYVPGKAMAVILRVAAVRRWVPSMRIAIVSVALETLTMMAVGGFLAFVLGSAVLRTEPYVWLIALGMAIATGLPTLPPVVRWVGRLGVGRFGEDASARPPLGRELGAERQAADIETNLQGMRVPLLAEGWIAALITWLLLGASFWAALRTIGVDGLPLLSNLPVFVTAVAFSVVAGFLSMLPGGLVVRDAVLMQLMAPLCGDANALIAAVLVRVIWLVSEVVACGILYVGGGRRGQRSEARGQGTQ
jgi:uncharacterized membrane protein YbhN (UPF0104 family)